MNREEDSSPKSQPRLECQDLQSEKHSTPEELHFLNPGLIRMAILLKDSFGGKFVKTTRFVDQSTQRGINEE
jgi:hypothetical protein